MEWLEWLDVTRRAYVWLPAILRLAAPWLTVTAAATPAEAANGKLLPRRRRRRRRDPEAEAELANQACPASQAARRAAECGASTMPTAYRCPVGPAEQPATDHSRCIPLYALRSPYCTYTQAPCLPGAALGAGRELAEA